MKLPTLEYTETVEHIFSSNIETINTVGNVFFNYYPYAIMSNGMMWEMRQLYDICQQMMNITDEEINAYIERKNMIEKEMIETNDSKISTMKESMDINNKIKSLRDS